MRILFANHVIEATVTAETPNVNYPATNITSQFLEKKFKSAGRSDVITVLFPNNKQGNCFFYAFSNVEQMTVNFYSSASILVASKTIDCSNRSGSAFFPLLTNVRWLTITAQSPANEDLYIGGVAFGESLEFPDPLAMFIKGAKSLSSKSTSSFGQTAVRVVKPLLTIQADFTDVTRDEYEQIFRRFEEVDTGHLWADLTEYNHDRLAPIYATTNGIEREKRDGRYCSFSINFTEAR